MSTLNSRNWDYAGRGATNDGEYAVLSEYLQMFHTS